MTDRPDVTVRCAQGHVMQRFRWLATQNVWLPSKDSDEFLPVYPGGRVGLKVVPAERDEDWVFPPAIDHWKWPLICNECVPRQSRTVRNDRMSLALNLLVVAGHVDVTISFVDGVLSNLRRRGGMQKGTPGC